MSQQNEVLELFNVMLLGVSDEVFLIDAKSMQVVAASDSALSYLDCNLTQLQAYPLQALLGADTAVLQDSLNSYRDNPDLFAHQSKINNQHYIYQDDRLKVLLVRFKQNEFIIATKNSWANKKDIIQALDESESRFHAILYNTPGLVVEFRFETKRNVLFTFVSDACKALLGVSPERLKQAPTLFYEMMLPEDRISFEESIGSSASGLSVLNWEGRVWIDEWQDTKWINLRCSPRMLSDGLIQWEGIMTNITQSKLEKYEIEQSRQRLAELSAHMTQIKEDERQRIGREIHDDLGGNLTAIKIGLASIIQRIQPAETALVDKAKNLEVLVDDTFEAAHRISGDLRPNVLELGIVAALEWQTKQFEKQIGIDANFSSNKSDIEVTQDQAITLFRICQEGLFNIAKHAKAIHVTVLLNLLADEIIMQIDDDGIGIQPSDMLKANSYGLRGMSERLAALDGTFSIQRGTKRGTTILVKLPYLPEVAAGKMSVGISQ
ncbi:MAG: histidine kinase [Methylophilaceae bacterium]|nr:histidine kinase [Methyloradius sp.]